MIPETENEIRSTAPRVWAPRCAHLFVVVEGDRLLAGGLRCALRDADEARVGRGDARIVTPAAPGSPAVTFAIPDRKISTRHARFFRKGETWHVEDVGSKNGTFVNGRQVTSHALADGDVVDVGRTVLRFRSALPTPPETADVASSADDRRPTLGLGTLIPALAAELRVVAKMADSGVPVLLLG
jgi:hypothetical protein